MRLVPNPRVALLIAGFGLALSGCSSGMRLGGPSWALTGGRDAIPPPIQRPSAPVAATPDQTPPTITYRGGRDPITGKAPTWGGTPAGIERRDLAPLTQSNTTTPPPTTAPPVAAPSAPAAAPAPSRVTTSATGRRTVEVLPGHSLALIAQQHRISIAALMSANKLRDPYVYPGQVLLLP